MKPVEGDLIERSGKTPEAAGVTKWRTGKYERANIERVECTRETAKAIWYMEKPWSLGGKSKPVERRALKDSEFYQYHDTWQAARDYLLEMAERGMESARSLLQDAQSFYGNVNGLKPPPTTSEGGTEPQC